MPAKKHRPGVLHRKLRLQHHRHTGRKLAHKHTSFHGLALILILAGLFIVGLNAMAKATAADLHVYGKISAPLPTEPAVILSPTTGIVTHPSIDVSGTCPVITPNIIVVLAVDGNEVGSVICDIGTFTIPTFILPGQHTLIARIYNFTEDRGPDSQPVYISFSLPSTNTAIINNEGQANGTSFTFIQDRPFVIFGPAQPAVWSGTFSGGALPYRVHIAWGDGAYNDYILNEADNHSFSHLYRSMKPHEIIVTAHDKDGRGKIAHYVAVTPYRSPAALLGINPRGGPGFGKLLLIYSTYLMILLLFGLLWKQRREFAYAPVPIHGPRPFMNRYNRSYPRLAVKHKKSHR